MVMSSKDTKMFNQNKTIDKVSFMIYADLEYLVGKIDGCKNNPENLSTTKVCEHIPSDFSMFTKSSFKSIESKHDVYRAKYFMKKFCESLKDNVMKKINFKK